MARLVVGRFDNIDDAKRTLGALAGAGFGAQEFGLFYVGPPGHHDLHPAGGDAHSDEGAKEAGTGAATGAAMGGAAGLALGAAVAVALPIAGIAAVLAATGIGAYVGSLHGALATTGQSDEAAATEEHPVEQPGGPRVAVCVERSNTEAAAIEVLERFGAKDIGRAQGEWQAGVWTDFDPRVPADPVEETERP
jgi:hypothetical protein